jgi:crotonobetainyl-CoA:carnitine CoA-transferase CaiB-like acyl-CoA transferase
MTEASSLPLRGVRVVELASMIAGPMCAALLADQGADVIKVEPPGGDRLRQIGTARGGIPALFATINRSKRSIALDVRAPRGRETLERLVAGADVFLENYRPGVLERMGIGAEALRRANPRLVLVSIRGFGEEGPYARRKVIDSAMQAVSGVAASEADGRSGRPRLVQTTVCDKATALLAAQAVAAALFARERGGGGQHVRLNMLDASVAFLWPDGMQSHTWLLAEGERIPTRAGSIDLRPTRDGWIAISAFTQVEFEAACRAFGRPDLLADPRLATPSARMENLDHWGGILASLTAGRTSAEVAALLDAEDVPYGIANRLEDLHRDPQIVANGTLVEVEHPVAGRARMPLPVARFGGEAPPPPRPAPLLGQHADEVLGEIGLSRAEIAELRQQGILG